MMVTLGIYVRRWQRALRRWLTDPRFHTLAQTIAYFGSGFLLSAASLGNACQSPKVFQYIPVQSVNFARKFEIFKIYPCIL